MKKATKQIVTDKFCIFFLQAETGSKEELISRMTRIWDCYWPFVRRYGDSMAAAFEALPKVDLPSVCTFPI